MSVINARTQRHRIHATLGLQVFVFLLLSVMAANGFNRGFLTSSTGSMQAFSAAPAGPDICRPLLSADSTVSSSSRGFEQTAAIGLMLGLHLGIAGPSHGTALNPLHFAAWQPASAGGHALAVMRYRECREQVALRGLQGG